MADPCTACSSASSANVCSCPPQNGISVLQQGCQMLIDGNIVNNPCYNSISGISTWTYKFFADYTSSDSINSILIPICANIQKSSIAVEEKLDSYSRHVIIPFSLDTSDPDFGPAPPQFQWLKIDMNNRYGRGVYAEYRISIEGNYPVSAQPIMVRSGSTNLTFSCQPEGYRVPGCPIPDRLEVDINCNTSILNNTAALIYDVKVQNKGASNLNNVQYQDILSYDGASINLGSIKISGDTMLQVSSIAPNTAIISGIIPSIAPDQVLPVSYTIPMAPIMHPGTFIFTNMITAACGSTNTSNSNTTSIEVVKLSGSQYFTVTDGNEATFYAVITNTGLSPGTMANISAQIMIPSGVIARFTDFSDCTVTFPGGGQVPLNTNITDTVINIARSSIPIPAGGGVKLSIPFQIVSTSSFQSPSKITGTLLEISGANQNQVFLSPTGIPASASINVSGSCTPTA